MKALTAFFMRDLRLYQRSPAELATSLVFALLVITLFPFALSPAPEELARLSVGLILIALLLAQFLGMDKIFTADFENGTLDQILLSPAPLPLYVLAKAVTHWAAQALPLLCLTPVFMLLLNTPQLQMLDMAVALTLLSLILSLLGTGGSALALGAPRAGFLLALILFPFAIPALIFAANLAKTGLATAQGMQSLYFLGGLFFLYLALIPFLGGAALKAATETA